MKLIKLSFYLLILLVLSSTLAIISPHSSRVVTSSIKMEDDSPYATLSKQHTQNDALSVLVDLAHGQEEFIPSNDSPLGVILAKPGYEMISLMKGDRFN
jgi:hypothetical protein